MSRAILGMARPPKSLAQEITDILAKLGFTTSTSGISSSIGTAAGDMIKFTAPSTAARLPIGTASQLLTVSGGAPVWVTPDFIPGTIGTTAGDMIKFTGSDTPVRLALGGAGQLLTVSGASPVWTDPDFKDTLFRISDDSDTSKKVALECAGITTSKTRILDMLDVPGAPVIAGSGADPPAAGAIGKVNKPAGVADVATTNLTNATPAGLYLIHATLADTTADVAAGSVTVTFSWTDDLGATSDASLSVPLIATGRAKLALPLYLASGNITYAVNHTGIFGTAVYALRIRCQFIG